MVLNNYSGYFKENAFYQIPISTESQIQMTVQLELHNGLKINIIKNAEVKIIDGVAMCQTTWYKYLARDPVSKLQIRYCSPHFGEEQEKENWDYYHHRHLIQYEGNKKSESVIIFAPFEAPKNHQYNKSYITNRDSKRYSFKKDPWPQIEDFLREITELIVN
jgi:hypothetical protein